MIHDLFSKRQRWQRGEMPDVLQCGTHAYPCAPLQISPLSIISRWTRDLIIAIGGCSTTLDCWLKRESFCKTVHISSLSSSQVPASDACADQFSGGAFCQPVMGLSWEGGLSPWSFSNW